MHSYVFHTYVNIGFPVFFLWDHLNSYLYLRAGVIDVTFSSVIAQGVSLFTYVGKKVDAENICLHVTNSTCASFLVR